MFYSFINLATSKQRSHSIKAAIVFIFILNSSNTLYCQKTVKIDGYVYLTKQTDHSGIKIKFDMIVPDTNKYSVMSASNGYFNINIQEGVYKITYSKDSYDTPPLDNVQLFKDTTLKSIYLNKVDLTGSISGTISRADYVLQDSCIVEKGKTLYIEAGTKLLFKANGQLVVDGTLIAKGNVSDSIIFTEYDNNNGWKGIHFNSTIDTANSFEYCRVSKSINSAITLYYSNANIYNCKISDNSVPDIKVPGIVAESSTLTVKNTLFLKNTAKGNQQGGAALKICGGTANIYSSSFRYNSCEEHYASAIYAFNNASINVFSTEFIHNSSGYMSSAISVEQAEIPSNIINCTFYRNDVLKPTFYYDRNCISGYGKLNIYNCLFIDQANPTIYSSTDALIKVKNSCFSPSNPNPKTTFYQCDKWLGEIVKKNVKNTDCDVYNNIFTHSGVPYPEKDDLRLWAYSECIDAGDNQYSSLGKEDILCNPRIYSINKDSIGVIDIGAFEFQGNFINEVEPANKLIENMFYPNPASNTLIFKLKTNLTTNPIIKIYNSIGMLIYFEIYMDISLSDYNKSIDISAFPSGFYICEIIQGNSIFRDKLNIIK
ncbi:MAG: T9SS type A sorting domain-containing protein [Candidatus Kapabacteria bacterium]|nr:T9SS type A sorting domain-containing protein [Candidatus Kapabacteria bacterium]